ncbi:MAG: alpha/beta fold hydrolase [Gammaproteobacteria bacterium]
MGRIKLEFENEQGHGLAGLLETPPDGVPIARYALFAHCFTCGKDVAAASRISRALAARGIAVLRFDFTGLGNSDGDFANTNFSSNVQDLLAAARALERDYQAPALLIGHSLGGAAVLAAAPQLESVKAVSTIGAPATASHVTHLFGNHIEELEAQGEAEIRIGSRTFWVRKQFLDDLDRYADAEHIGDLRRPLLVFHSPVDTIVNISEAATIYQAAKHPKSFISLDDADHLLSDRDDAEYVAETLVAWASRYLDIRDHGFERSYGTAPEVADGEVLISELDRRFLRGLFSNRHQWMSDEPKSLGGSDLGPTPYDLLLMALGACTSMTLRMYANHKKLPVDDIQVSLSHERIHAEDCDGCAQADVRADARGDRKIERITRRIKVDGALSPEQRARLIEMADRCPVHRTLGSDPEIVTAPWNSGSGR